MWERNTWKRNNGNWFRCSMTFVIICAACRILINQLMRETVIGDPCCWCRDWAENKNEFRYNKKMTEERYEEPAVQQQGLSLPRQPIALCNLFFRLDSGQYFEWKRRKTEQKWKFLIAFLHTHTHTHTCFLLIFHGFDKELKFKLMRLIFNRLPMMTFGIS